MMVGLLLGLVLGACASSSRYTGHRQETPETGQSRHALSYNTSSPASDVESGPTARLDPVTRTSLRQLLSSSGAWGVRIRHVAVLSPCGTHEEQAASRVATHSRARLNYAHRIQRVQTGSISGLTTTLPPPRPRA